ncbi:MAG: helix-turn-helix domain-containing protein [Lachnospiraceae bacterium]|nr:helix-turn-helix domain-containing protein [Lachnospiraceae bacterium]
MNKKIDASFYKQPVGVYNTRILNGNDETIDYLPGYKYRIWFNNIVADFDQHKHNALEIILCNENSYSISFSDQTIKLHEGDILFVPPNALHRIEAPDEGSRFILLFDLEFLQMFHNQNTIMTFLSKPHLYNIVSHPHIYSNVYSHLMHIITQYFSNDTYSEICIYADLLNLFREICSHGNKQNLTDAQKHTVNYDKFVNILSYIDNNYAEDLSLEKVANIANFSKFHFARLFKQYTNSTFYEYLSQKRIMVAQELILKNIPVTDVAFQTGFNNLTTFCRCFKKYVGCPPTQFKIKFENDEEQILVNNINDRIQKDRKSDNGFHVTSE